MLNQCCTPTFFMWNFIFIELYINNSLDGFIIKIFIHFTSFVSSCPSLVFASVVLLQWVSWVFSLSTLQFVPYNDCYLYNINLNINYRLLRVNSFHSIPDCWNFDLLFAVRFHFILNWILISTANKFFQLLLSIHFN